MRPDSKVFNYLDLLLITLSYNFKKPKRELKDLKERGVSDENSAIGSNWRMFGLNFFTKEEILESDIWVAIMSELIEARHEQGISQKN